jgi:TrmH family RNA methyltransferase
MNAGALVETAFVCRPLLASHDARRVVEKLEQPIGPFGAEVELVEVGERAFERIAFGDRADGVVLVVRIPERTLDDLVLPDDPLVVVTEDVEKPGNLGAILRTADAVAADAVIAAGGTDLYNPNVIRASIGTVFSLQVAAAPAAEVAAWLRSRGVRIVASRVDASRLHVEADLRESVALVLGSEAEGLSDAWRGEDVEGIRLPMLGIADSLNVSAAAADTLSASANPPNGIRTDSVAGPCQAGDRPSASFPRTRASGPRRSASTWRVGESTRVATVRRPRARSQPTT